MNIIKVTRINDDGSVAFEAMYGPEEARLVLEVGTNFLLSQGIQVIDDAEDDDDVEITEIPFDEDTPPRH